MALYIRRVRKPHFSCWKKCTCLSLSLSVIVCVCMYAQWHRVGFVWLGLFKLLHLLLSHELLWILLYVFLKLNYFFCTPKNLSPLWPHPQYVTVYVCVHSNIQKTDDTFLHLSSYAISLPFSHKFQFLKSLIQQTFFSTIFFSFLSGKHFIQSCLNFCWAPSKPKQLGNNIFIK